MTATVRRPDVTAFVAAVRGELDDLSRDEIDELTGGLEADLDDAIADGPDPSADPAAMFGVPAAYAAELRAAAGLPPRAVAGGRRGAASSLGDLRRRGSAWLTSRGWWPAVRDFAVTLRPAWWVARAGVIAVVLTTTMGMAGRLVVFLVLAWISVQMGRHRWAARGALARVGVAALNVVAALMLLPALAYVTTPNTQYFESQVPPQNGLWMNGSEVRNVLPYDSQGRPLRDVQLFDENGRPLEVGDSAREPLWGDGSTPGRAQVPGVDERGDPVWNTFPLRQVEVTPGTGYDENGAPRPDPVGTPDYPRAADLPVPPLFSPAPAPTSAPTPTSAPSTVTSPAPSVGSPAPAVSATSAPPPSP